MELTSSASRGRGVWGGGPLPYAPDLFGPSSSPIDLAFFSSSLSALPSPRSAIAGLDELAPDDRAALRERCAAAAETVAACVGELARDEGVMRRVRERWDGLVEDGKAKEKAKGKGKVQGEGKVNRKGRTDWKEKEGSRGADSEGTRTAPCGEERAETADDGDGDGAGPRVMEEMESSGLRMLKITPEMSLYAHQTNASVLPPHSDPPNPGTSMMEASRPISAPSGPHAQPLLLTISVYSLYRARSQAPLSFNQGAYNPSHVGLRNAQLEEPGPTSLAHTHTFELLSTNTLMDLMEAIVCASDFMPARAREGEGEGEGEGAEGGAKTSSSAMFESKRRETDSVMCIEGVLYGDRARDDGGNYASLIANYASSMTSNDDSALSSTGSDRTRKKRKRDERPPTKGRPMRHVPLSSLTVRVGEPYWYLHQGDCEHVWCFEDVRMHPSPSQAEPSSYPRWHHFSQPRDLRSSPAAQSLFKDLTSARLPSPTPADADSAPGDESIRDQEADRLQRRRRRRRLLASIPIDPIDFPVLRRCRICERAVARFLVVERPFGPGRSVLRPFARGAEENERAGSGSGAGTVAEVGAKGSSLFDSSRPRQTAVVDRPGSPGSDDDDDAAASRPRLLQPPAPAPVVARRSGLAETPCPMCDDCRALVQPLCSGDDGAEDEEQSAFVVIPLVVDD